MNRFKRDTRAFLLALLVFAVATVLAFQAFAQEANVSPTDNQATQEVIADQLDAFRARDHARAYSHAAPNIRSYFNTVDKFVSMVSRGYGAIYTSESHVFGRSTIIGGQIHQEVIITDTQGKQWQAVYTLRQQEDGSWKITGVKMNPFKGATT